MNPFARAYLSEANIPGDELLSLYSFLPFQSVRDKLVQNNNVVLLGRTGVGKTMVLRLFEPTFLARLYSSASEEHRRMRKTLPSPVLSVYLSLSSFEARLKSFRGGDHGLDNWMAAYGDFLNILLTYRFLESLETLAECREWCRSIGDVEITDSQMDLFAENLGARLASEVEDFDGVKSILDLKSALESRHQQWTRSLNRRTPSGSPEDASPFGSFLQHAAEAVHHVGILPPTTRIFCVIDQYDSLRRLSDVSDFRPMFNQAMHEAARSGSRVEYKLGSRRYGMNNRFLLDGNERLEDDRELVVADLDAATSKVYDRFMHELFTKRLAAAGRQDGGHGSKDRLAYDRLPELAPREESKLYLAKADTAKARHLKPFLDRWKKMGLPGRAAEEMLNEGGLRTAHPLTAVLTAVAITRWLRDGAKGSPLKAARPPDGEVLFAPVFYVSQLRESIDLRYSLGTNDASRHSAHLKAVNNFVRDAEQAALFFLASAYKNKQKYFCGFDTLLRVSSNVALVFIEILNAAYEDIIANGGDPLSDVVTPEMQSRAAYYVSANHHERIASEYDYGETLRDLVRGLGSAMRRVQIEPTVPVPAPNGFSVSTQDVESPGALIKPDRGNPQFVLQEAENWGILEKLVHEDKTPGNPRRYKYYLNRIYCPHANITERTKKDPPYVSDLDDFITSVLEQRFPHDLAELIERAARSDMAKTALEQITLFEG